MLLREEGPCDFCACFMVDIVSRVLSPTAVAAGHTGIAPDTTARGRTFSSEGAILRPNLSAGQPLGCAVKEIARSFQSAGDPGKGCLYGGHKSGQFCNQFHAGFVLEFEFAK